MVTSAGGESVDLTTAADIVYANKPLTHADEKQMLDRLHRRGQTKEVRAFHIITSDTVDERVERLIERKREEYERFVPRSKEFVRWFEEDENENIRKLLESMIGETKLPTD